MVPLESPFGGLLRSLQHVADTAHGLDHLLSPLVVDLAAQVADVDVDDIGESIVIHIPNVFDDHGAAQGPAAVTHQVFEDAELFRRELNVLAGADDFAANAIEREVAHLQAFRRRLTTPQASAHAGQELHEGERLYQVIVSSAFQTLDAVVDGLTGAQNQHGRRDLAVA